MGCRVFDNLQVFMLELNKIYNGDCRTVMNNVDDSVIDLAIFSPPYNVGIGYESWTDTMSDVDYWTFTEQYLRELYRIGKDDCRYCINIPYEINIKERGGRILFLSEYYQVAKKLGFQFSGVIDLEEKQAHRSKNISVGSFNSHSSPYIYNPKECVLVLYKNKWKKDVLNPSYFNEDTKYEFMILAQGMWEYRAQTQLVTKAQFSIELPLNCLKMFSGENELIIDPFMGSGTTALACLELNRNFIGCEISKLYCEIANQRINRAQNLNSFF